jgi:hypothetical protein
MDSGVRLWTRIRFQWIKGVENTGVFFGYASAIP